MLLPCPDGHRLLLSLAACDADPLRAARFTDGKHNREDPILELRLDIIGIDRPGEGDRPFKRAGDDFPREPVVSLAMATRLATLSLLLALGLTLLSLLLLSLALNLVLVLVLLAELPPNRQGVLINDDFNIFRSHPRKRNIHLIALRRLTDVHRYHHRCRGGHQTGIYKALFE